MTGADFDLKPADGTGHDLHAIERRYGLLPESLAEAREDMLRRLHRTEHEWDVAWTAERDRADAAERERDEAMDEVASCDRAELAERVARVEALRDKWFAEGWTGFAEELRLALTSPTPDLLLHCHDCNHTFTPSEARVAGTRDVEDCPKCTLDEAVEVVAS